MNRLANSTSPYLLQHANNPVNWYPWGPEALKKAKDENKLILVSIGYSACHWCHVMEHESFEDADVASVMNEYFVCIKVDREERPDVDQIYMSAIQLMSGRGGWPLNCICLPDQRPIYGGTYFRKNDWTSLLFNLADFYKTKPQEAEDYAVRLTEGIKQYESVPFVAGQAKYTQADLQPIIATWRRYIDDKEGGFGGAPKFPMPNNWVFLMRYAHLMKDKGIAEKVKLTLKKMAYGGIYDHIGGGFARYAVDGVWHVPHFEKMLYDNGQLLSLYAEAYTWQPDPLYKKVVQEIVDFVQRELTSPEGGFYSALDADSEGIEGKFYIFAKAEIDEILGDEAELFNIYFNVTEEGNWEEEHSNVFFRREDDEALSAKLGLPVNELTDRIAAAKQKIFDVRSKRVRPGLDNKILASWNGLMLKGLCDAYRAFNEPAYLELALQNALFISNNLLRGARIARVYKPNVATDNWGEAFLDDYANVVDSLIALYEVTFDESWLIQAQKLADYALAHYYSADGGIFYFTADNDEQLIARKSEIMDGVIPSSNSVMARNLKKLGLFFDNDGYLDVSAQMLRNIVPHLAKYGTAYPNWTTLLLDEIFGVYEIAITGPDFETLRQQMEQTYIPDKIMLGGNTGTLPLLAGKFESGSRIYVCRDKTCQLPADNLADALKQINN
ncbi:thioredoxin domain-containing protein [Mucilaginibacter pallidiroseus]|uniref:Thioredoxin domain-containing protein n=1 Tax=Mucilaginibacter pallidiroseus TaxID=2599295 RepID=A0A563UCE2_9SPHI|nr:thioredoxin domain-containing protein [Mucilaginibacter pallidiroseus]TWR28996.1 thioredoxin domain-containing protein [Mucilaginibacter pallidiroseus]